MDLNNSRDLPDGVYTDLDDGRYHGLPRLSQSGIKDILVSPLHFYTNRFDPVTKLLDEEKKDHFEEGKAYHKMILEGREAFERCYAVKPNKSDFPDALSSLDDLKSRCKERGLKVSGTISELTSRLREDGDDCEIFQEILEKFQDENAGKEIISTRLWLQMMRIRAAIDATPSVCNAIKDGMPEVSVLWTDKYTGVKMKARFDFLRKCDGFSSIIDLKTFANVRNKDPRTAVNQDIANNNYLLQAAMYQSGYSAISNMLESGQDVLYGNVDFLRECFVNKKSRFFFVHVQRGTPHVVLTEIQKWETFGKTAAQAMQAYRQAESSIQWAAMKYRQCMERFGMDRAWVTDYGLSKLRDEDLPIYYFDANPEIYETNSEIDI